jgi:hypothetical protein
MFVRIKGKEPNRYLQIVENRREGKRTMYSFLIPLYKLCTAYKTERNSRYKGAQSEADEEA